MAKPVVFVMNASSRTGTATVQSLSEKFSSRVEIVAGARRPAEATQLKNIVGVKIVHAEMGKPDDLKDTLKGVHALLIVTPSGGEKVFLTVSTAQVAKEVGVKRILVTSALTACLTETILGKEYGEIESALSSLAVQHTIIRFPYFIDDMETFKTSINEEGEFCSSIEESKPLSGVVVADIGKAAAAILAEFTEKHVSKVYKLTSDHFTFGEVAEAFSKVLGKKVKYIHVPFNRQARLAQGIPERAVNVMEELVDMINSGSYIVLDSERSHYTEITGEQPTSVKSWILQKQHIFL